MAVKITLCLSVTFSLVASITCQTYTCGSFGTDICATKSSDGAIKVNENWCETGSYCLGSTLLHWSSTYLYPTNTTIFCTPGSFFNLINSSFSETFTDTCLVLSSNKKFKSGNMIKSCSSDADCELVDGTYATCFCTFNSNSNGICFSYTNNEDWFGADYVRDCGPNNTITDRNTAVYWYLYRNAWLLSLGDLSCEDSMVEINFMQQLQDQITTGASYDPPNFNGDSTAISSGDGSTAAALMHGVLILLALH